MNYYIVITPPKLVENVRNESLRIVKTIYKKDVKGVYYRVKTQKTPGNPRRLYLKGDGEIVEMDVSPHISLLHNINLKTTKELENYMRKLKHLTKNHPKFILKYDGVGNYNQDFTFFVGYKSDNITKLKNDIVDISRGKLPSEYAKKDRSKGFVPHITILYDDISPDKVKRVQNTFDKQKFQQNVLVDSLTLWRVTSKELIEVASFKLS